MSGWKKLGTVSAQELAEARLELHHAAQLPAMGVGRSLIPPRPDDSHTTLAWQADAGGWVTDRIPGPGSVQAGLRPADLTLTVTGGSRTSAQTTRRELPLAGATPTQALAWLKETLEDLGIDASRASDEVPYEVPERLVPAGSPFRSSLPPLAEVGSYFADADLLLQEIVRDTPGASPVHTWAHHFDMATLITLPAREGEETRTVGVGFTPGDGHYPVPYFYVTPWPYPEVVDLPALPSGGEWRTEGWTGAVLLAPRLLDAADPNEQERRARDFLGAAVGAARSLLGETD